MQRVADHPWHWLPPLCVLVFVVYAGTLDHGFHFDDDNTIVHNSAIQQPVQWLQLWTDPGAFSRTPGAGMFRPLLLTTFAGNYAWTGQQGWSWHVVNVGLHAAVSVLVVLLGRCLGGRSLAALMGGVLFALHPLCVQPTSYISSRSELLATMFLLLCLLGHVLSRRRQPAVPAGWHATTWIIGALVAGLLCKATVATAPLLIGAYEILVLRQRPLAALRRCLPTLTVVAGYLLVVRGLLHEALVAAPVRDQATQLLTQTKALVYYLRLLILPHPLSVEHAFVEGVLWQPGVWGAAALVASIGWLLYGWRTGGERRYLLVWSVLVLAPTIVVPLNVLVSEHRLYPALAGLLPCAALALPRRLPAVQWAAIVVIILATTLSVQRTSVWASETTLWQDAARWSAGPRPHVRLALVERAAGRLPQAAQHLQRALAANPEYAPAWNNLGNVQKQAGDVAAAEQSYQRALELLPKYPEALTNLAAVRVEQQRFEEARGLYLQALAIQPDHALMHNNLGTLLLRIGEPETAERHLRRALALGGGSAAMWRNLGGALEGQGRRREALEALHQALAMDVTYAPAWLDLGQLLATDGRLQEADEAWGRFLSYWRGDPEVAAQVRRQMRRPVRRPTSEVDE